MSWLYVQTWLWYLIAFVVGIALAWVLLVVPQQRRLRNLEAGSGEERDIYAAGQPATAASGAALFRPDPDVDMKAADKQAELDNEDGDRPAPGDAAVAASDDVDDTAAPAPVDEAHTEQLPAIDPALSTLDTTEFPIVPNPDDDSSTTEIPIVRAADPDTTDTGTADANSSDPNSSDSIGADGNRAEGNSSDGNSSGPDAAGSDNAVADDDPAAGEASTADESTADESAAERNGAAPIGAAPTGTTSNGVAPPSPTSGDARTEPRSPAGTPIGDAPPGAEGGRDRDRETSSTVQGLLATAAAPAGAVTAGRWAGSAVPGPDGSAPSTEYTIKGNEDSMLFHTPESPYYGRTIAEVWFANAADAEAAGFTSWTRKN